MKKCSWFDKFMKKAAKAARGAKWRKLRAQSSASVRSKRDERAAGMACIVFSLAEPTRKEDGASPGERSYRAASVKADAKRTAPDKKNAAFSAKPRNRRLFSGLIACGRKN